MCIWIFLAKYIEVMKLKFQHSFHYFKGEFCILKY